MSQSAIPDTNNRDVALMAVTLQIVAATDEFKSTKMDKRLEMFIAAHHKLANQLFNQQSIPLTPVER